MLWKRKEQQKYNPAVFPPLPQIAVDGENRSYRYAGKDIAVSPICGVDFCQHC